MTFEVAELLHFLVTDPALEYVSIDTAGFLADVVLSDAELLDVADRLDPVVLVDASRGVLLWDLLCFFELRIVLICLYFLEKVLNNNPSATGSISATLNSKLVCILDRLSLQCDVIICLHVITSGRKLNG